MGQSIPVASLLMRQRAEESLIHQAAALGFRGASAGWRNGLAAISKSSLKGNAQSCPWGRTAPGRIGTEGKASILPPWGAASGRALPARCTKGGDSSSLLVRYCCSAGSSSEPPEKSNVSLQHESSKWL